MKHISHVTRANVKVLLKREKRDLIGTWNEIQAELKNFFFEDCPFTFMGTYDGALLRWLSIENYTPYIFTEANKGELLFRKRTDSFYMGSGQYEMPMTAIFKLEELPNPAMNINVDAVRKIYNVNIAPKKSHEYY